MHLAELNIAAPKYPLDDQRMANFIAVPRPPRVKEK